jgi:hypothetical protein
MDFAMAPETDRHTVLEVEQPFAEAASLVMDPFAGAFAVLHFAPEMLAQEIQAHLGVFHQLGPMDFADSRDAAGTPFERSFPP